MGREARTLDALQVMKHILFGTNGFLLRHEVISLENAPKRALRRASKLPFQTVG